MSQGDNSEALLAMVARSVDLIGTEKFAESIAQLCSQTSNFGSIYISAIINPVKYSAASIRLTPRVRSRPT